MLISLKLFILCMFCSATIGASIGLLVAAMFASGKEKDRSIIYGKRV
ncbi:hypothetical protein Ga0466249_004325 [Sporomusaceae bacterium BoRhaA]|nr:hypothetical protein [Pelorhabdus rhamnosifermentans]